MGLGGVAVAAPSSLDLSFGNGGRAIVAFSGTPVAQPELFAFPDGHMLAVGGAADGGGIAVTALSAGGDVEAHAVTPISGMSSVARAAQDGDGAVTGGTTGSEVVLLRYGGDSQPDQGFGVGGIARTPVAAFEPSAAVKLARTAVVVEGGERKVLALAGWERQTCAEEGCRHTSGFAVARYDDQGNLDDSFGVHGVVNRTVRSDSCGIATPSDVVATPDGDLVVAYNWEQVESDPAGCMTPHAPGSETYLTRLDAGNGYSVDPAFPVREIASAYQVSAADLNLTKDGKLLAGGRLVENPGGDSSRAWVGRFDAASGNVDDSFLGGNGPQLLSFGVSDAAAMSLSEDETGDIVVAADLVDYTWSGGTRNPGTYPGFGVARLKSDGALDGGFATGGQTVIAFADAGGAPHGQSAAISGGKILIAGTVGSDATFGVAQLQGGAPDPVAAPNQGNEMPPAGNPLAPNGPAPGPLPLTLNLQFKTKKLKMTRKGIVALKITNPNAYGVHGRVTLDTVSPITPKSAATPRASKKRRLRLGQAKFSIQAEHATVVKIKVSKAARRLLRHRRKLRIKVTTRTNFPADHRQTSTDRSVLFATSHG